MLYSIASYPNGQYLGVLRQAKAETALLNVVVEYKVGKTIDKVKATAQAADSSKPSTEEYAVATLALLQGTVSLLTRRYFMCLSLLLNYCRSSKSSSDSKSRNTIHGSKIKI